MFVIDSYDIVGIIAISYIAYSAGRRSIIKFYELHGMIFSSHLIEDLILNPTINAKYDSHLKKIIFENDFDCENNQVDNFNVLKLIHFK